MSLLTAQNLKFGFLDGILFQDAAFQVEETDRIGLIGSNGVGKTSLFKLITGELQPSEGGIVRGGDVRIGYMEQYLTSSENLSLYDEVLTVFADVAAMEEELEQITKQLLNNDDIHLIERQLWLTEEIERRDGLVYRAKSRSALIGLGFTEDELSLPVAALSGGQRSKMALCKLLLSNANLLLLDEPTNNLDIDAVVWLEDYLSKYKGAFLVVSHDRYFLDKVTSSTIEISHKKITQIKGNYSVFQKVKAERELAIEREYEKNLAEIKRIEAMIEQQKRFNQERNYITIASKEKQIERIKAELVVPDKALSSVSFSFKTDIRAGEDVLIVDSLEKSFGTKPLFKNFSLTVRREDRVFLLGPNGCGKSTFLKIINREIIPDDGLFRLGANVKIGYFDQNIERLSSDKTVLDEVWDMFRALDMTQVRNALALFLFRGDDVFKNVSLLSGGERARLSLLKIMLAKPNLLILDEPTNHLDIASREVLESALADFNGTLLVVSHDRYFINKLATRTVYLTNSGAVNIDGNYDAYLAYRENVEKAPQKKEKPQPTFNSYKAQKEQASNQRKRQTQIKRTEEEISRLEHFIEETQHQLASPELAADFEELMRLSNELEEAQNKVNTLYEQWETLQSEDE